MPGAQQRGLMLGYLVLFQRKKLPALSSCHIFVGENTIFDQETVLLHGREDEAGEIMPSVLL